MAIFAPLNIISGYSFLQSGLTVKKISAAVQANNYFGMGLADDEVMHGIPSFIKGAEVIKKPFIIGIRINFLGYSLCLYALNEEGYINLIKINNEIQESQISKEFLENHSKSLAAVLETKYGKFVELFSEISNEQNRFALNDIAALFEHFYLGMQVTSREDVHYANSIREFAHEYAYECIAFPRIKYVQKKDAIVIDIVTAIANDTKLEVKNAEGQDYFMKEEDYKKIYTQKELKNTIDLVSMNSFVLQKKRGEILKYSESSDALLNEKCLKKLGELHLNDEKHLERLNYELKIIKEMGYPDYFLLVEDYVNYAKNNGILVGPGRGSSAGSLVAYLLNITEVDPLDYNLQFERFLNPFRKTMPDIDVDFMDIKRDALVQYVREKFGKQKVANIVSFQTIKAKQSIRDIGRVYGYKDTHIDLLCKRLSNDKLDLRKSYQQLQEFRKLVDSDKYFLEIVTLASKIEGLPRQTGLHAAGVIINNKELDDVLPLNYDFNGNYISQYEMNYLEDQGLLKMDFLGLTNLTTIFYCLELAKKNHGIDLKFDEIPYDTKEAIDVINSGYTMGVFQLESSGMRHAIRILKPSSFEDIVALLALFRPGPMDEIKKFANRKQGLEKVTYYSEALKEILAPTYGIIVYQEQVNKIAQVMAGFSMGEADIFRRAISKKKKDELAKLKDSFIGGCLKNGYSQKESEEVYGLLLKFADYGFNKSHSVVYSITALRMAYLKAHFPLEFYTSILATSGSTSETKFSLYVSEMNKMGYKMIKPDINESGVGFVIKDKSLVFPLSGIKYISAIVAQNIVNEREKGPFKDFYDFIIRMTPYKITDEQINNLINSGAFDNLSESRESLRASIKVGRQYVKIITNDDGQLILDGIVGFDYPKLIEQHDDPMENLEKEYESIGIMLSNNPLNYKKDLLISNNVVEIGDLEDYVTCNICGIIKEVKKLTTKTQKTMAFLKLFDLSDEIEVVVFSEAYQQSLSCLAKNNIVLCKGKLETRNEECSFIANKIELLEKEEEEINA